MKNNKLSLLIATLFMFCLTLSAAAQNVKQENIVPGEDVILQWNRVLGQTLQIPNAQPPTILPVRSFAMMHLAMFDAVNSIDGTYTPYLTASNIARCIIAKLRNGKTVGGCAPGI